MPDHNHSEHSPANGFDQQEEVDDARVHLGLNSSDGMHSLPFDTLPNETRNEIYNIVLPDQWVTIQKNGHLIYTPSVFLSAAEESELNSILMREGLEAIPFTKAEKNPYRYSSGAESPLMQPDFVQRVYGNQYGELVQQVIRYEFDAHESAIAHACENMGLSRDETHFNLKTYHFDQAETFVRNQLANPVELAYLEEDRAGLMKSRFWLPDESQPHRQALKEPHRPQGPYEQLDAIKKIRALHEKLVVQASAYFKQIGVEFHEPKLHIICDSKAKFDGQALSKSNIVVLNIYSIDLQNDNAIARVLLHEYVHEAYQDHKISMFHASSEEEALPKGINLKDASKWRAQRETIMELRADRIAAQIVGSPDIFIKDFLVHYHNAKDAQGKPRLAKMPDALTQENVLAAVAEIKHSYRDTFPKRVHEGYPHGFERLEDLAKLCKSETAHALTRIETPLAKTATVPVPDDISVHEPAASPTKRASLFVSETPVSSKPIAKRTETITAAEPIKEASRSFFVSEAAAASKVSLMKTIANHMTTKSLDGAGVAMGVAGIYNQVTSDSYARDIDAGGTRAKDAQMSVAMNSAAVGTGLVAMASESRFLGPTGIVFAGVAGGYEGMAAQEAGDGHRAAKAYGTVAGAITFGLIGTALGTGATTGAIGLVSGSEVPVWGNIIGGVAGFGLGTYAAIKGGQLTGEAFDGMFGTQLQKLDDDGRIATVKQKQQEISAIAAKAARNQHVSDAYAKLEQGEVHAIHEALAKHPNDKALTGRKQAFEQKIKALPPIEPYTNDELTLLANTKNMLAHRYQEQTQQENPNPEAVKTMAEAASVVADLYHRVSGQANAARSGHVYVEGKVDAKGQKTEAHTVDAHLVPDLPALGAVPAIIKNGKTVAAAEHGAVYFTKEHDLAKVAYRELFGELPGSVNRVIYDHDKIGLGHLKDGVKHIVEANQQKFLAGTVKERQAIANELYKAYTAAPTTLNSNNITPTKSELLNAMAVLHRAADMQDILDKGTTELPQKIKNGVNTSQIPFTLSPFEGAQNYNRYAEQAFVMDKQSKASSFVNSLPASFVQKAIDTQLTSLLPGLKNVGWANTLGDQKGDLTLDELKAAIPKGFDYKNLDTNHDLHITAKEITDILNQPSVIQHRSIEKEKRGR